MRVVSDNFQLIHPAIRDAVTQKKAPAITAVITRLIAAGCDAIDLNLGPLGNTGPTVIPYILDVVRSVTHLPLFIDSPHAEAAQLALATGHRGIHINGFSLQPERFQAFLPLMEQHPQACFVGYLLTESGAVPTTRDGRLHVAAALIEAITSRGAHLMDRLIIDPVVVPLLWDEGAFQALEVIRTLRALPDLAGRPVLTMAGLSNLTSGKVPQNKRQVMECTFIPLLAEAGLDYLLMNTSGKESLHTVRAANLLTGGLPFSWESLSM